MLINKKLGNGARVVRFDIADPRGWDSDKTMNDAFECFDSSLPSTVMNGVIDVMIAHSYKLAKSLGIDLLDYNEILDVHGYNSTFFIVVSPEPMHDLAIETELGSRNINSCYCRYVDINNSYYYFGDCLR